MDLARAGWNLAILIQTKFEKAGVGEAPRCWWPQAINSRTRTRQRTALCITPLMTKLNKAFQQRTVVFIFMDH
jgi:hypothetical protein